MVTVVYVVDAIAGAVGDPKLGYAVPDGFDVPGVSGCQSVYPDHYARDSGAVVEFGEPSVERSGSDNLDHVSTVVHISESGQLQTTPLVSGLTSSRWRLQKAQWALPSGLTTLRGTG